MSGTSETTDFSLGRIPTTGAVLAALGGALVLVQLWMVFFWVPTEVTMGVVQRIFYVKIPAAWVGYLAFGMAALCSGVYLWLRDDRLDAAALAAVEGGLAFFSVVLVAGPLWGKISWGTYWTWEPRLTLSLLLWAIFVGYLLVRSSVEGEERARRLAAVVAIIGAFNIPLVHVSVNWLRSLHPEPVVMRQDGMQIDPRMLTTLMVGLVGFTLLFLGLFAIRYGVELVARRRLEPDSERVEVSS
jgi:heme exporter protein C